jgi:SH3-like domain-containing protein
VTAFRLAVLALLLVACGGSEVAITPLAMATTTATAEPASTRTPRPVPTPSHTPAPVAFFVANTGGDGAVMRAAPGKGDRVVSLAEGVRVVPQGEEQDVDGRHWLRVQDPNGRTGWVAQELLAATPVPTRTPARR